MLKRIIFDVDNTLLDTDKDCFEAYKSFFRNRNVDLDGEVLYSIIDIYEEQNKLFSMDKNKETGIYKFNFNKEDLSNFIKNNLSIDFGINDFMELQEVYGRYSTLKDSKVVEVLDELSKNYEIVALTKWYVEPQKKRLDKVGILKYFSEVYGFENAGIKPSKKAFMTAMGECSPSECMVIGDSISSDIIIPKELGMKTIYINYYNRVTNEINVSEISQVLDIIDGQKRVR